MINMKSITSLFLVLFISLGLFAQTEEEKNKQEKIEAFKRTFITMQLGLTVEEAEKFWPLYNEVNNQIRSIREEYRSKYNEDFDPDALSDEELQQSIDDYFEMEQARLDLWKEYTQKFTEVLPLNKVVMLSMVEAEFKRQIMNKFEQGGHLGKGGPGGTGQ